MKAGHHGGSASRVGIVVLLVALAVFASSSGRAETVAYWVYGDSGTLTDLVGDDHTLTNGSNVVDSDTSVAQNPVPNPDPATNGAAGSISFDATSIAPKTTSAGPFKLTTTSSWTFEGWLQTSATTGVIAGDRHSSGSYSGWYLCLQDPLTNGVGKLRFFFSYGTAKTKIDGSTVVNDNNPHHFAAVWDHAAGKMRLYVDGNLEGEASPTVGDYTSDAGFGIGAREKDGDKIFNDDPFNGLLDELRFSDVALTPSEFLNYTPAGTVISIQ